FQAEDGIRDRTVTGVQTCALPIYGEDGVAVEADGGGQVGVAGRPGWQGRRDGDDSVGEPRDDEAARGASLPEKLDAVAIGADDRSEERRVGKEWRFRWGGERGREK